MKPKFELPKDQKDEMAALIKGYFETERGEDIGNLASLLLLDFFIEKLAPSFYNRGVEDCHTYMTGKIDDIFELQK